MSSETYYPKGSNLKLKIVIDFCSKIVLSCTFFSVEEFRNISANFATKELDRDVSAIFPKLNPTTAIAL